ncbi:MAG TPA: hypothetical protein VFB80_07310 [Pirellulaceae bacterium]|nr:hypothetical protein [Pirellulaceae bacterium]
MQLTVEVPGELAPELSAAGDENLGQILALGLREWRTRRGAEFPGLNALIERLAQLPDPQDVLALRPTPEMQQRADDLLAKSRNGGLTPAEQLEWKQLEFAEHIVRMAKAHAALKLQRN